MGPLRKGDRGRHDTFVVRGICAAIFTTNVAIACTTSDAADAADAAPLGSTACTLAVVAISVVTVCMAIRAAHPRLSRAAVAAVTAALALVVCGELAAAIVAVSRGDALVAGMLLAAAGFTAWFAYGIAAEDSPRVAEQKQKDTR
jgi:uncharacterized membrane protein